MVLVTQSEHFHICFLLSVIKTDECSLIKFLTLIGKRFSQQTIVLLMRIRGTENMKVLISAKMRKSHYVRTVKEDLSLQIF